MKPVNYSKYTTQGFSSWQEERKYLEEKWGKAARQIHPVSYKDKLHKLKEKLKLTSSNETWNNHTTHNTYGNFSLINTDLNPELFNYTLYPDLRKTTPVHIELHAGQALVIPKGWWHYVRSYEQTFFMNYWTSGSFGYDAPVVITHDGEFNRNHLNLEDEICVWGFSKGRKAIAHKTFSEFLDHSSKLDYYWTVITTSSTEDSSADIVQKKKIVNTLKKPTYIEEHEKICEVNIGICPVYHQTPLHHDGEDGLLCVTQGIKKIILFPPSDSKYLYPVNDVKNIWSMSDNYKFCYNMYHNYNELLPGENSGSLLLETCKDKPLVLSNISQLYNSMGDNQPNKIVYSVKNDMNKLWWELYMYNKDGIISKEIYQDRDENGDSISPYTDSYTYTEIVRGNSGEIVLVYGDIYRSTQTTKQLRGKYLVEETQSFNNNVLERYKLLGTGMSYEDYVWVHSISTRYTSKMFGIHPREHETDDIYVQWYGLTNDEFLNFLIDNKYPSELVDKYSSCEYNIQNEISIIFDARSKTIKRTAFFGII